MLGIQKVDFDKCQDGKIDCMDCSCMVCVCKLEDARIKGLEIAHTAIVEKIHKVIKEDADNKYVEVGLLVALNIIKATIKELEEGGV